MPKLHGVSNGCVSERERDRGRKRERERQKEREGGRWSMSALFRPVAK